MKVCGENSVRKFMLTDKTGVKSAVTVKEEPGAFHWDNRTIISEVYIFFVF